MRNSSAKSHTNAHSMLNLKTHLQTNEQPFSLPVFHYELPTKTLTRQSGWIIFSGWKRDSSGNQPNFHAARMVASGPGGKAIANDNIDKDL